MADDNARPIYINFTGKFGLWVDGVAPTSYHGPINFTQIEVTPPAGEFDDLTSNMEDDWGAALASVRRPTDVPQVSIAYNTFPRASLALMLGATVTDLSQTGTGKTDQAVTTILDEWVKLPDRHIDASSVEYATAATPETPLSNALIEIDPILGMVKALDAGAVGAMVFDYDTNDAAGEVYAGGQNLNSVIQLVGTCTNRATGKRGTLDMWQCVVGPTTPVDFAVAQYLSGTLGGRLVTPSGKASPYDFLLLS